LVFMVPEFSYESDVVNRSTQQLVDEVKMLVLEMREGIDGVEEALRRLEPVDSSNVLLAGMDKQNSIIESRLDELRKVLAEGFRLDGR